MSSKNVIESNTDKILNSDIYDLTSFVDDIKKRNIDGVDEKETLLVGIYGYLGYEFTSLLQNAIVTASELANEAIPTRAKFDRNVITHALSLGVKKVNATPANMKVFLMFPEKALRNNMVDGKFTLYSKTAILFDDYEFHTDYDIDIYANKITDSTNGTNMDYVYTAKYNIDQNNKNPISDIDNEYLPPVGIYKGTTDNIVCIITNLHQVEYVEIEEKIIDSDAIANKTLNFSFNNQLAHFFVEVEDGAGNKSELIPVYDGLYNQEIAEKKYCYYQYINSNTIRIRFDPNSYQPTANCNVTIKVYTTQGYSGNFNYSEDLMVRLTSDEYTNLYMIVKQRGTDGSTGGLDRKSVEDLQKIIPKEALSRGFITTLSDLRNYFNSLNNETSVLHVFRKEDNILTRVYYIYCLMKDSSYNVIPTNTIPVYVESSKADPYNGKLYIESGTPFYMYKYGEGADLNLIKNNYIGYMKENVVFTQTVYEPANQHYNFFHGVPTQASLEKWCRSDDKINPPKDIEYDVPPNDLAYKFVKNSTIMFKFNKDFYKEFISDELKHDYLDEWYTGVIERINGVFKSSSPMVDNNGNYVYQRDNNGNLIYTVDELGNYVLDEDGNKIPKYKYQYYYSIAIRFYDPNKFFSSQLGGSIPSYYAYCSNIVIPAYFDDTDSTIGLSDTEKMDYIVRKYSSDVTVHNSQTMLLESISGVNDYSYNAQTESLSFNSLKLSDSDNIRFCTYSNDKTGGEYEYLNTETWKLGEVLSVEKNDGRIVSIEVLVHNTDGSFNNVRYRLPISGVDDMESLGKHLNENDIIRLYKITKFLYTTPMSIVLSDDSNVDTHRITASYYLDYINENRLMNFKCINSNSPIQFVMSSVDVKRTSYLSSNRYEYNLSVDLVPNTGDINETVINRTQVIGVFYKNGVPAIYCIGKYDSSSDSDVMKYLFKLYTRPFDIKKNANTPDTVDDDNCIYIGDEWINEYLDNLENITESEKNEYYYNNYNIYSATGLSTQARPLSMPSDFNRKNPRYGLVSTQYLDLNTQFRIYTLYAYNGNEFENTKYYDGLSRDYFSNNVRDNIPLTNIVPYNTMFKNIINNDKDNNLFYSLKDMVLTNVYETTDGINFLYDYSNIMNSYVTMVQSNNLFNPGASGTSLAYIINRVPCLRYFYFNDEDRVNNFIKEMKRKILYVLDALDPLETTFGLDFKFFNTYGPSKMYHITDDDGDISDLIDNVALTMTFRAKFYNENSDKDDVITKIEDYIKKYIEDLESLDDIHFPNITTAIETEFKDHLIYFEYVDFNKYDSNYQHIITNENMEMLTVVPEFLNVDTNDFNGSPYINIRIVT